MHSHGHTKKYTRKVYKKHIALWVSEFHEIFLERLHSGTSHNAVNVPLLILLQQRNTV